MPDDATTNSNMMDTIGDQMPQQSGLKIPPPVFLEMQGEILESGDDHLKVRFPVQERYQNPFGYMQGGMLVAAMDNTIGPLSFMVAPPNVTMHLDSTFIRPVTPDETHIIVEARVTERTRRQLFIHAEVRSEATGKLMCFADAAHTVIGD